MCSSVQFSSTSSCSGVKPTAPSTPKPPALLTATTTSRQWVKAKIGNSMPSWSQMSVCMRFSWKRMVKRWRTKVDEGLQARGGGEADGHRLDAVDEVALHALDLTVELEVRHA